MPLVDNCCRCFTLRTGTIVSGVLGVVIAIASIIIVLITKAQIKTIVADDLDPFIVKIIIIINLVMTILISTLLVIGAIKRSRFLMLPWVVLGIILAIGLIISLIYTAFHDVAESETVPRIILLVTGFLGAALFIYLWVVVFSYFQLVRLEKSRGPYGRPPYQYKT